MAKNKTIFVCNECGNESSKWLGKCPAWEAGIHFFEQKIIEKKNSSLKEHKNGKQYTTKNLNSYEAKRNNKNINRI